MIDVNDLRKGATFTEDGQIYKVLSYSHNKPGRGNATIRLTVRNMRTGTTRDLTYNSGQRVQDIEVESHEVQFLYDDGEFLTFMDIETFEQPQLRRAVFGDDVKYLTENLTITLNTVNGEIIDYVLPTFVDQKVTIAEPGYAGDTANNPTKRVVTETGLEVQVPLYIESGTTIRVKTEDGSYVSRV
jgi:elongation factor P